MHNKWERRREAEIPNVCDCPVRVMGEKARLFPLRPPSRRLLPNLLSVKAGLLKRELQPTKAVNQGLPSEAGVHMDSNDSPLLPLPATHQSLSPHKHPEPIVRAAGVCCGTQSCLATAPPLRNRNSAQCGPVGREGGSRQMVKGTVGGGG